MLRLDERRGLALSCDGVGTKVIVCEELRRFDTVGIDLVAMNANDIVCVGAEPIALLDYVAVEEADPEALGQIGEGLRRGAELAGIEIPGGELAVLPELIRGHPSPTASTSPASAWASWTSTRSSPAPRWSPATRSWACPRAVSTRTG